MNGAVGSLALSGVLSPSTWVKFPLKTFGFDRVMIMSKLYTYTCALANQAIHPFGVDKLVLVICRG